MGPPGEHPPKEAVDEAVFDNCFLAGTLVAMADGSKKPIEEVRAGDRVKAMDPEVGEVVDREVVRRFRNVTDTVVDVTWAPLDRVECMAIGQRGRGERHSVGSSRDGGEAGEDGEPPSAQTVRCTPEHPWWVESQRRWRLAGDLRVGDLLMLADGRLGVVRVLEVREEVAQTFNFEVEREHSYFVAGSQGQPGALVHNFSLSGLAKKPAGLKSFVHAVRGTTKANAAILRRNIRGLGVNIKPYINAHHMVPARAAAGKEARDLLAHFHIDVNHSFNGVLLKETGRLGHHGRGLHSNYFIREVVTPRLRNAVEGIADWNAGRQALFGELRAIARDIRRLPNLARKP